MAAFKVNFNQIVNFQSDSTNNNQLSVTEMEQWLWDAACIIRGATDAPKFKDFILPLVFYKRLSDIFEDEFAVHIKRFKDDVNLARQVLEQDHADAIQTGRKPIIRFIIPDKYSWKNLRTHSTHGLGQFLTEAMRDVANSNPDLKGVLDVKDFNEKQSGQRILDDDRLEALIEVLSRHKLGINDAEPDILGRAYEYLLRKFAEGQGQSAGEFYTPKEVGWLIAALIDPKPRTTIYDPACGSAGLLIKSRMFFELSHSNHSQSPHLFGQEINPTTFAIAKMNMFLHDFLESNFAIGDTLKAPGFSAVGTNKIQSFDYVVANPMWNQSYDIKFYENDPWKRFSFGSPTKSSADWGWVQHILASLKDNGKAAVVLDTNAVNRGSGSESNKERDIRKKIVESGVIDTVILLPENLFYNTGAPGIIIVFDKTKASGTPIRLINASRLYTKVSPKNQLEPNHIEQILIATKSDADINELCSIIDIETIRDTDYDLSPSRHVPIDPNIPILPLHEATVMASNVQTDLLKIASLRTNILTNILSFPISGDDTIPDGWISEKFEGVIADKISGDWGVEHPEELKGKDFVRCSVIRGTDFPDVERGNLSGVPYRYIRESSFEKKHPIAGDILVEISGGGKYQNTGRSLFLSSELIENANPDLMFTNFTKLLRVDTEKVIPKYAYYSWKRLYDLGRTARYERQPTNIKNFKLDDFLASEFISYPEDKKIQQNIVNDLDHIHKEIKKYEEYLTILAGLRRATMAELLQGLRIYNV